MSTPLSAEDCAGTPDEIEKQAWIWLRLLTSGNARSWDAQGFQRWLRADPAHQQSFNEARRQWEAIRQPAGALLRTNPEAAAFHQRTLRGAQPGRRVFLGAAVSAAAVAAVAVVNPPLGLWPAPSEWGADFRTATGEQRTLALADRVNVVLNTQTSIRRQLAGGQTTGIDLISGEAAVDLQAGSRPFSVVAGAGRSLAGDTGEGRFEVRALAGRVCVTCVEGSVRVEHPAGFQSLKARQQTVYDANSISGVAPVAREELAAWRNGELVFNQTRLAEVLEEINRYRAGRVMLMNTAARGRAVSGRFAIASLDLALSQLQHAFDLRARSLPGGVLILS